MTPTGAAWAWFPGCRGRQDFSPGRTSRSMALGLQDRTGQSQAPLTAGKLGAGGPRTSRSEVGQSEPRWGPPLRCCILLSHLLKIQPPSPPKPPSCQRAPQIPGVGGPVQNFLETSPSRPKPQGLTGPSPNKTTASPAFRWLSPPPSRGHSLSPHLGPLGLPQPLAEPTPSPPGSSCHFLRGLPPLLGPPRPCPWALPSSPTPPHPPLQPLCPGGSREAEIFGTSRVVGAGGLPQLRDTRAEPGVGPSALVTCVHKAKDPAGATETPCSAATSSVTRGTDGARVAARSGHPPVPPEPLVHCAFFPDTCFLLIDTCV